MYLPPKQIVDVFHQQGGDEPTHIHNQWNNSNGVLQQRQVINYLMLSIYQPSTKHFRMLIHVSELDKRLKIQNKRFINYPGINVKFIYLVHFDGFGDVHGEVDLRHVHNQSGGHVHQRHLEWVHT